MLALLLASMLTLALNAQQVRAEPRIWTVDDDGPADSHTIQEAVNAASEGDTISVYSGTYLELVLVNKTVSLVGTNRTTTVIGGHGDDTWGIIIEADHVNITGFSITGGISAIGFSGSVSDIRIVNCNIYNTYVGVGSAEPCSHVDVIGCDIFNNGFGINLRGSYNVIEDCNIFSNNEGISIAGPSHNYVIANSSLWNNREIAIEVDGSSSNHVIKNSYIFNNTQGVAFFGSDYAYHLVTNCEISGNIDGIYLSSTSNSHINITNCDITDNEWGIRILFSSYNNSIYHNNFIDNTDNAVDVSANTWNANYPSGGNYWSDYTGLDLHKGPYQNETGSDGIGDTSYEIGWTEDKYPLMTPRPLPDIQKTNYDFYELLANYKKLESAYENLQSSYYNLNTTHDELLANYTSLQAELDSLTNELNGTRNIMYFSLTVTIIFIAATVYLAIRKPKAKTASKTT